MTLHTAQGIARSLGYSIRRTGWDTELRVVKKGLTGKAAADLGYYTSDLQDAVDTCKAMARLDVEQGMDRVMAS